MEVAFGHLIAEKKIAGCYFVDDFSWPIHRPWDSICHQKRDIIHIRIIESLGEIVQIAKNCGSSSVYPRL